MWRLSKVYRIAILALIFSTGFFFAIERAFAIQRYGMVGVSYQNRLTVGPKTEGPKNYYSIDLGYFFSESLAVVWSFDLQWNREERVGQAVGIRWFPTFERIWMPYLDGRVIYLYKPSNDFGWQLRLGIEANLRAWTKVDNLKFFFESGVYQMILDQSDNEWGLDPVRLGLSWSF